MTRSPLHTCEDGAATRQAVGAWPVFALAIATIVWPGRADARLLVPFPPPSPIGWSAQEVIKHYGQPWKVLPGDGAGEEVLLYGSEFSATETQCNQGTMIFFFRGKRVVQARYVYPVCWRNLDTLPVFGHIAASSATEVDCSEMVQSPDGHVQDCRWRSFQWNSKRTRWTAGVVSSPIQAYSPEAHAMAWRRRGRAEYRLWTLTVRDVEAMQAGAVARPSVGSGPAGEGAPAAASKESGARAEAEVPRCPKGSRLAGARPPQGVEQWCEHRASPRSGWGKKVVRHGPQWTWFDNGLLNSRYVYEDGRLDGPWTEWYPNGKKRAEGRYSFDTKDGLQTEWLPDGTKKSELRFNSRDPSTWNGRSESWKICDDAEWPELHRLLVDHCKRQAGGCGGLPQLAEECRSIDGGKVPSPGTGSGKTELSAYLVIDFEDTGLVVKQANIHWERRRDEWRLDSVFYSEHRRQVDLSPGVLAWLKAIKTDGVKLETIRPLLSDGGLKVITKRSRNGATDAADVRLENVLRELAPGRTGQVRRAFEILAGQLRDSPVQLGDAVANGMEVRIGDCELVFLRESDGEHLVKVDCVEIPGD